MKKISGLDLNTDSLKNQAKDIYNKLKDFDDANGIMDKIKAFFGKILYFVYRPNQTCSYCLHHTTERGLIYEHI